MNWFKRFLSEPASKIRNTAPRSVPLAEPMAQRYPTYAFTDQKVRIAAIGDLHGRLDLMMRLTPQLDDAAKDPSRALIEVYLGDYVDRGANPKAVIDFLINRSQLADRKVICLAGNHEQMLLAALEDDAEFKTWLGFGGQTTLMSYGISAAFAANNLTATRTALAKAMPPDHLTFLKSLSLSYQHGGFFFTHAGIRPGIGLDMQETRDLLWIRHPFLETFANFGAIVVHGHTPTTKAVFRSNRIGIDTGAYRTGVLTCLIITSDTVTVWDTSETGRREPLHPS